MHPPPASAEIPKARRNRRQVQLADLAQPGSPAPAQPAPRSSCRVVRGGDRDLPRASRRTGGGNLASVAPPDPSGRRETSFTVADRACERNGASSWACHRLEAPVDRGEVDAGGSGRLAHRTTLLEDAACRCPSVGRGLRGRPKGTPRGRAACRPQNPVQVLWVRCPRGRARARTAPSTRLSPRSPSASPGRRGGVPADPLPSRRSGSATSDASRRRRPDTVLAEDAPRPDRVAVHDPDVGSREGAAVDDQQAHGVIVKERMTVDDTPHRLVTIATPVACPRGRRSRGGAASFPTNATVRSSSRSADTDLSGPGLDLAPHL